MRVGLFGPLGAGDLGNDGSLSAVLAHLRAKHPGMRIEACCSGPEEVSTRHGVHAVPLSWHRAKEGTASRLGAVVGAVVDAFRTARWVRRQDVVIVPGTGVLETTPPPRPSGWPYSLFLLSLTGKLLRTKVVLLAVGADTVAGRANRAFLVGAARLAHYRSYRDEVSRDAVSAMGVDTSRDPVHTDLVFALPNPVRLVDHRVVGVGVMDYHGGYDDRDRAARLHRDYVSRMTRRNAEMTRRVEWQLAELSAILRGDHP